MKKCIIAVLLVAAVSALHAQTNTTNLKPFVGKYQLTNKRMMLLQILLKDDHLVLKQLWDNQEIPFKQTAPLEFYNSESSFPLKFSKDDKGTITGVLAFNRDSWIKVPDDFKPELQKIVSLTPEQLKPFEGKYQQKSGDGDADDFLQIRVQDGHLIVTQLWDHAESPIYPVSPVDFFNEGQTFPIKFTKNTAGAVLQLLANHEQIWIKVK
jgi:hypothetical protein